MADQLLPVDTICRHAKRRLASLETLRGHHETQWLEIQKYICPDYGRFGRSLQPQGGQKVRQNIFRNTAGRALRTLSAGIMAGVSSPARPWIRLVTPDPELALFGPVRKYLEDVRNAILTLFARSNLYDVLPILYEELGGFGTGCMFEVEDDEEDIRFYHCTAGEYYIGCDHRKRVNTIFRVFNMTAGQLVTEFGIEYVSQSVRNNVQNGRQDSMHEVCHFIEPNMVPLSNLPEGISKFAWRSVYYETAEKSEETSEFGYLGIEGFDEFPVMAPRWKVISDDVYGVGPGHEALPDVKQLQAEVKMKVMGIEKSVNPPLIGDSRMRNSINRVSGLPGAMNWYDAGATNRPGFEPLYQLDFPLNYVLNDIYDLDKEIQETFYENLFRIVSNLRDSVNGQVTATEIRQLQDEQLLQLGPVLQRMNDELYDPMVNRTYNIMRRRRLLPPPPPDLVGVSLRIEYIDVLTQAQKRIGTTAIDQMYVHLANVTAVTGDPSVSDKVKHDLVVDHYGEMLGVDPDILADEDEVAEIRNNRAQSQRAAQMADIAKTGSEAALNLSETKSEQYGTNALDALMTSAGAL